MTQLELWVHTPLAQSLGLALLHSLWEGAAIALILAAVLCVVRSPGARYGAACLAMLVMLASFAVTVVRVWPQPLNTASAPRLAARVAADGAGLPISTADEPRIPTGLALFLPWIAPFWAAGVLLFQLRALGGWMAARRLWRSGVCRAAGEWQERLDGLAARLRVSKSVALLESCLADAPVVMGYLRPVILMPVGLLAGLPAAQVEAILIHELAHIRRQDYLVNLVQAFAEGLLFYHPAVWWISGIIRTERENCCDDVAVAATGDARGYAAALAALEQNRWTAHELALAANGGNLMKRIRRLLQKPERPRAAGTLVTTAALLAISAAVAFASWQAQPARKQVAPILPVATAVAAPEITFVKPATVLVAQAQQVRKNLSTSQQTPASGSGTLVDRRIVRSDYRKWLNEDVAYIIHDGEREAFKRLTTDQEIEHFIEQFWLKRDPTPGTEANEFKEEYYRRIAYANDHFGDLSGLPGWKTDRGRIYITYGPPNEIEDHPAASPVKTFPYQQWLYKYIEGVGNNIIIEFVDPTFTKEYRLTMDPAEKDALRYMADAVQYQKDALSFGQGPRPAPAVPITPEMSAGNIFVSTGDAKLVVSITSARRTLVRVTLPSAPGKYDVIGETQDVHNKPVANFRDVAEGGAYDAHLTLGPGSYTMKVLVRNRVSGEMQTHEVSFYVN